MEKAARWPAALLATALLVVALLGMAAWRLAEQEQALDRERVRERLENAASLVVRESERALQQAEGLTIGWDERGLWRTGGAPLVWSPAPAGGEEAAAHWFASGEDLEFGKGQPEKAALEYKALLGSANGAVRAGALMRIARCQRTLGRTAEALESYTRLAALGTAPVARATAGLVGLRERATLSGAAGEREKLKALLERGETPIGRATFEFYAQGIEIDAAALAWAEGAEELWKRAAEVRRGRTILAVKGRKLVGEWSREGKRGTGRLVEVEAVERRLGKALEGSAVRWQLTEGEGAPGAGVSIRKAGETGLPWGVRVALAPEAARWRGPLLFTGLLLLGLAILGTLYLAYRAVRRELHVAEMQSEFVAAVSHEFRTPITALTHLTELLESGGTAEDRRPLYYTALARETRRLREMVENLLDFGRIEAGQYRYKPEEVTAEELVRGVVEEFRELPGAAGREMVVEANAGGVTVTVDRGAMRRAVWNLLDNAAKYSPAGTRITTQVSAADGWAAVSVRDEGPGIARDERKRIFQKFVRGRTAGADAVKGTGIGLAMVNAIVRAHGGRVELESEPGAGSRFTIRLPMERRH